MPYESKGINAMEIVNEFFVLAASLHLIVFSDFTDDPEIKYSAGWSINLVVLTQLLVNTAYLTVTNIISIVKKIRSKYRQWIKKK